MSALSLIWDILGAFWLANDAGRARDLWQTFAALILPPLGMEGLREEIAPVRPALVVVVRSGCWGPWFGCVPGDGLGV